MVTHADDLDGAGVVLLQRDSDDQGAPTAPTSLLGTIPVPGQFEEGTPQTMDATAGTTGAAPSPGPQQGLDVPELAQLLPPSLLEPPKVPVDPALQARPAAQNIDRTERSTPMSAFWARHSCGPLAVHNAQELLQTCRQFCVAPCHELKFRWGA